MSLSSLICNSPLEQIIPSESIPLIALFAFVIPASGNGVQTRAVGTYKPSATLVPQQIIWKVPLSQQLTLQTFNLSASGCFSTCSIFQITIDLGISLSSIPSISQVFKIRFCAISFGVASSERYFLSTWRWYFIANSKNKLKQTEIHCINFKTNYKKKYF